MQPYGKKINTDLLVKAATRQEGKMEIVEQQKDASPPFPRPGGFQVSRIFMDTRDIERLRKGELRP